MDRKEFSKIVENCCDAIVDNDNYFSSDAWLEIMQSFDEYNEPKVKNLGIHDVSNRRELLLCSCDNPDGFKEMEQGKETCSKCKKPY